MTQTSKPDTVERAVAHLDEGEIQQAFALLFPYARRNPRDSDALYWLGIALARAERNADSCRVLGRTLEVNPRDARALRNLALHRAKSGDQVGAEPLLRLAHTLDPDARFVRNDLGAALSEMGRLDEARTLMQQAFEAAPENPLAIHQLMFLEFKAGALDRAREWADRLLRCDSLDDRAIRDLLFHGVETSDRELARLTAQRLFDDGPFNLLMDMSLLAHLADAFPVAEDLVLRGDSERITCPACGAAENVRPVRGFVFGDDPLDRLATLGVAAIEGSCQKCGFYLPEDQRSAVLWPELSVAVRVDAFPGKIPDVGHPEAEAAGSFDEPAIAGPKAGTWFTIPVVATDGAEIAAYIGAMAAAMEGDLPEIGELGRAERRAQFASTVLRNRMGVADRSAIELEDGPQEGGLPDWMLLERVMLLDSKIPSGPWRLDHRCACGEDLTRFMCGNDPSRRYDPDEIDAAAIRGEPFSDALTGATMLGFNCDACGRLHTWVLGIVPGRS